MRSAPADRARRHRRSPAPPRHRPEARRRHRRAAPGQGRLGDRPPAACLRRDGPRLRRCRPRDPAGPRPSGSRRALARGHVLRRAREEGNGSATRDRRVRRARHDPALVPQRRPPAWRRPRAGRRGGGDRQPYTADVTRTLPVSGECVPQRQVYEAVLDAADAAFSSGAWGRFDELNRAGMRVIAQRLHAWGLLPGTPSPAGGTGPRGQYHRRWSCTGQPPLGLDVHDCAKARNSLYRRGSARGHGLHDRAGPVLHPDDLLAPAELRGIGVRIEDDILVTPHGPVNLSGGPPP